MATFNARLRELRAELGLSQQALSNQTKITKSSINMYERGEREPGIETLELLGDFFGVDMDYLLGKSNQRNAHAVSPSVPVPPSTDSLDAVPGILHPVMRKIPLLGKTACGEPIFRPGHDDGYALLSEDYQADFAMQVKDDSMKNAGIHDGDIVFFVAQKPADGKQTSVESGQESVKNGQIVAVFAGNEVTLKRAYYYDDKNKLILQPENPAYEPLVYVGEELNAVRIIGRAVAHLRRL